MERIAIILNGEEPNKYLINKLNNTRYDYIITADGGYDFSLKNNIKADVVVGDFDSTKMSRIEIEKRTSVISFPKEKDTTDGEIAVDLALSKNPKCIHIYGANGKREDHFLGNLSLLYRIAKDNVTVKMINNNSYIYMIKDQIELSDVLGYTISMIPFTDYVFIDYTKGLNYPLNSVEISNTNTLGISNVAVDNNVVIKVRKGYLLVIVNHIDVQ